jgi:hypothetical protein
MVIRSIASVGCRPEILMILIFIKSLLTYLFQREDLFPLFGKEGERGDFYNLMTPPFPEGYE